MRLRPICLSLMVLVSGSASATQLNFNLSGDAARLGLVYPLEPQGLEVDANWTHHKDDGDIVDAGLHLVDIADPGRGAFDVGLGGKVYGINEDEHDIEGGSLAIGGKFRYTWPTFNRVGIGGHAYYAPEVTSTGDVDSYLEAAVRAEYLITKQANAYVGYRRIRIGNEPGDETETFESGVHAGIRLQF